MLDLLNEVDYFQVPKTLIFKTRASAQPFLCKCVSLFLPGGGGEGWGALLGIFGGGVPPGSSDPDPISDQKR